MRLLVALATAVVLLAGVAGPHQHAAGATHECAACTVGGGLEARDATPRLARPDRPALEGTGEPAASPLSGAPLGAVPGQSPPA